MSAVEAAVVGTTVLSYRPTTSVRYDNPLPNSVGIECYSEQELLANVQKVLRGESVPLTLEQRTFLQRFISFNGNGLCSDQVFDAIDRNGIGRAPERKILLSTWLKAYAQHQRQLMSQRLKKLLPGSSSRKEYKKLKFSGINAEMVNDRVGSLQVTLSRFSDIKARDIGKDLIELK